MWLTIMDNINNGENNNYLLKVSVIKFLFKSRLLLLPTCAANGIDFQYRGQRISTVIARRCLLLATALAEPRMLDSFLLEGKHGLA